MPDGKLRSDGVHLTALDWRVFAEGIALDSALAPSMMNSQHPLPGRGRARREVSSRAWSVAAFPVAPFDQAQRMFLAPPINADRGDQDPFVADVQAVDLDGQQIEF